MDVNVAATDFNDDLNYLFNTVVELVLVNSDYTGLLGGPKLTNQTNTVLSCCELRPISQK